MQREIETIHVVKDFQDVFQKGSNYFISTKRF